MTRLVEDFLCVQELGGVLVVVARRGGSTRGLVD